MVNTGCPTPAPTAAPAPAFGSRLAAFGQAEERPTRAQVLALLVRTIARIDGLLTRQLNAVLHHPDFQRLEASWRGLEYLVRQVPAGSAVTTSQAWPVACEGRTTCLLLV